MNFGEKILLGCLLVVWLTPLGWAWPQRTVSPSWAWIRIVAALWLFTVLELMVWFPGTPNLDRWLYAGVAVYIVRFFIKRKRESKDSK
jgi:hypothetical protein